MATMVLLRAGPWLPYLKTITPVYLLIVFKYGNHGPACSKSRIVECVDKTNWCLSFLFLVFYVEPSSLIIRAIAVATDFPIIAISHEKFCIEFLCSYYSYISSANIDNAIWYAQSPVEILAVFLQLFVQRPAILRQTENKLLDLVKVMYTEQSSCIFTVSPNFFAEARAEAN